METEKNLLASKSHEPEEEEEEEEEEALSLCDLPLNEENQTNQSSKVLEEATQMRENEEEFNFGSTESEMCAADEVFFKGQILPLRLSVSSESGLASKFQPESRNPSSRCLSRSESMDHSSSGGLTSINSSRSSSTKSYYSSTTTTTTSSGNSTTSIQKTRNNFHSCPSPNPQIRVSSFRLSNVSNSSSRTQKSTIWDFFRIGLVRAPEIELQDLKVRNNINGGNRSATVSRNSSSGSSSNNGCSNINGSQQDPNLENNKMSKQSKFLEKKRRGLFNLSGCNCSINAVETVTLNNNDNIIVIKKGVGSNVNARKNKKTTTKKEEGKQAMSRHRTFEWLKELSHGSYVVVDDRDGEDDQI
ncbi:hypothetical protein ACOSQ4_023592 [Xanthoceras sorbifolium]